MQNSCRLPVLTRPSGQFSDSDVLFIRNHEGQVTESTVNVLRLLSRRMVCKSTHQVSAGKFFNFRSISSVSRSYIRNYGQTISCRSTRFRAWNFGCKSRQNCWPLRVAASLVSCAIQVFPSLTRSHFQNRSHHLPTLHHQPWSRWALPQEVLGAQLRPRPATPLKVSPPRFVACRQSPSTLARSAASPATPVVAE